MATIDSYITGIRNRGIAATDLDDAAVTGVITEAISEYSRYRPVTATRTFETVKNQQAYTWAEMGDADGLSVLVVAWNPSGCVDEWGLANVLNALGVPASSVDWHLPSLEVVDQIKRAAHHNAYSGNGYQVDCVGGDLYLTPTPRQSGYAVFIIYTKSLSSVEQVKSADRDMFLDLVESMVSYRIVNEIAQKSQATRIKTPEYEIQTGEQIGVWRKHGQEMRNQFISKANAGFAAGARS